jgi:hypothetical protein
MSPEHLARSYEDLRRDLTEFARTTPVRLPLERTLARVVAVALAALPPSHDPRYTLVLGPPGSGKSSWIARPEYATRVSHVIVVDADLLRQWHPLHHDGLGVLRTAWFCDTLRDDLYREALSRRCSVTEEAVGRNPAKIHQRLTTALAAGYEPECTVFEYPHSKVKHTALLRAATGRFAPPDPPLRTHDLVQMIRTEFPSVQLNLVKYL